MKLANSMTCLCLGAAGVLGLVTMAQADIIADWTFETSLPTTAGPVAPEVGSGAASGHHTDATAAYSNTPAGNGSTHSYSSTKWANDDYWQFQTSTVGFENIIFQLDQASTSNTTTNAGPGTFQLSYSTDNVTYTDFGSTYTVHANNTAGWSTSTPSADANSSHTFDLSAITALNKQAAVYFRVKATAAFGGSYLTNNSSRVDNVVISGTALPVPEPASLGLLALGGGMILVRRRRQA